MATNQETLVVYVPFPGLHGAVDMERLGAIAPGVEVLTVPYEIEHELRVTREQHPFSAEMRALEADLDPAQADAFARADVVWCLDVPMDLPGRAPRLRWIQAIGSGVGQFVSAGIAGTEIVLTNGAGIGAAPIAEWVMARVLQIIKRLPEHDANARLHQWQTAHAAGQLARRTMTIVGLGAIGREVAVRARPFGVHLIGIRRSATAGATDPAVDELFAPDSLLDVLGRSDVVVLAAPGTDENRNMFDEAVFAATKPGAIFVNVARGTLVDEPALIAALESGHLSAAATDVARLEPLPPEDPLWSAPNLLISPHSSAGGEAYAERAFELFCRNLTRFVAGEPLLNLVDIATYTAAKRAEAAERGATAS
jgi:phosphoglycerate dehydrogenase-like enzyme